MSADLLKIHTAVFLFGLSGLFAKFLSLPASTIVLGRTLFASAALIAYIKSQKKNIALTKKDWPLLALGAVLAIHWHAFFYSIQISTIAVGLLTFSSFPLFVVLLEAVFNRAAVPGRDLALALLVIAGLMLVVPNYDLGNQITIGALWGIFSGFTFAVLQVLNRRFVADGDPVRISLIENGAAFFVLLICSPRAFRPVTPGELGLLVLLGVLCTAVAHTQFIAGLRTVRAQTASVIAALEPVYGILLGAVLLREVPSLRTVAGGAIILAAIQLQKNR